MRLILANHVRNRSAQNRGGDALRVCLDRITADVMALDDALAELAKINARQAKIVQMRVFARRTIEDIAKVLGVGLTTVRSDWRFANARLRRVLGL